MVMGLSGSSYFSVDLRTIVECWLKRRIRATLHALGTDLSRLKPKPYQWGGVGGWSGRMEWQGRVGG